MGAFTYPADCGRHGVATDAEVRANAAMIVTAVNCHAALLAACRAARDELALLYDDSADVAPGGPPAGAVFDMIGLLDAAIDRAEPPGEIFGAAG